MSERIGTRVKCKRWCKEGTILAYSSRNHPVVEWDNGAVSVFTGEYDVLSKPQQELSAETFDRMLDVLTPSIKRNDPLRLPNPYRK